MPKIKFDDDYIDDMDEVDSFDYGPIKGVQRSKRRKGERKIKIDTPQPKQNKKSHRPRHWDKINAHIPKIKRKNIKDKQQNYSEQED